MSTKTMKELCVRRRFSFVFGCGLSASVGDLLKIFSRHCKNLPRRVICRAGKWTAITVNVKMEGSIEVELGRETNEEVHSL